MRTGGEVEQIGDSVQGWRQRGKGGGASATSRGRGSVEGLVGVIWHKLSKG